MRHSLTGVTTFIAAIVAAVFAQGALADAAGNSVNAQMCQQAGFGSLYRPDGTPFANAGLCTSYAAQGGAFVSLRLAHGQCPSIFPPADTCLFVTGFGLRPSSFAFGSEISFLGESQLDQFNGPTVSPNGTVNELFAAFRPCTAFVSAKARAFTTLGFIIAATITRQQVGC